MRQRSGSLINIMGIGDLFSGKNRTELQKRADRLAMAGIIILMVRYVCGIILNRMVPASSVKTLLLSLLLTAITMLPPVALCRRKGVLTASRQKAVSRQRKWVVVLTGAAGCVFLNFLMNLLPWQRSSGRLFTDPEGLLLAAAAVGIAPAVCEELAFRGCALGYLEKYGIFEAVVFSAWMFGLFHSGLRGMILALLSGLVLGWVKIAAESIWAAAVVHLVNNLTALAVSAAGVFLSSEVQTGVFYAVGLIAAVVTVVCAVYWYSRYLKSGGKSSEWNRFKGLGEIVRGCPAVWVFTAAAVLTGMM